jgi:hypothetical protein
MLVQLQWRRREKAAHRFSRSIHILFRHGLKTSFFPELRYCITTASKERPRAIDLGAFGAISAICWIV